MHKTNLQDRNTAAPLDTRFKNRPAILQPFRTLETPNALTHAKTHQELPRDTDCEKTM